MIVEVYSKPNCKNCDTMADHFSAWLAENEGVADVKNRGAEDNIELLMDNDVFAAPAYRIIRGDEEEWVSGLNPDLLIDKLNGDDGVWGF